MKRIRILPIHMIPLSFLAVILSGALLLMLPAATAPGAETDFLTALFTATTSVCVTGLVVVDTYAHWTVFGQFIILLLIQIGGLGVVSVVSMLFLISRKKFALGDRMLLGDSLNIDKKKGLLSFLLRMFRLVFVVETAGAVLCAIRFVPDMGFSKGLWASLFQAVSAFCNAGMDILGPDSLIRYNDQPLILLVTMFLIVTGGLGFVVLLDLIDGCKESVKRRFPPSVFFRHLPEHSKIVLLMSAVLILSGAACFMAAEYRNPGTMGGMNFGQKVLNSFFQSVTLRTAGFATIPQENLTELSCMAGYVLMFIGGSPVGTAGGIKTVTVFLIFMNALSYIRGKKETVVFHKRVSGELMRKASAIFLISLMTVSIMTFLLMTRGGLKHTDALYEVISALGTVGVSRAITPTLDSAGKIMIIISMFLGRVGPISMAIFFTKRTGSPDTVRHAEGTFFVG
ncbi:MAG: potassium transporter TrkH [Lachnospiraceae bacterium]|nr:potassium transporter TrkH [Lachnospiraceae bacterium]